MSSTTNVWTDNGGDSNFQNPQNWSLTLEPAPGQFVAIDGGSPELTDATINGFTIDIVSQQTDTAALALGGATLGANMLVEDTNSSNGQSLLIEGQTTNDGTILLDASLPGVFNGTELDFTGPADTLTNNGVISVGSNDGLFLGNGNGGVLLNDGIIDIAATRLFLTSPIEGTGTINVDNTTIDVGSSIDVSQTLAFTDTHSAIVFESGRLGLDVGGPEGTVDGFQAGDTLEFSLLNFTLDGSGYSNVTRQLTVATNNGTLLITMGGSLDYTNTFHAAQTGDGFAIVTTAVETVACFAAGTRIRTARGDVPVETLMPGDAVAVLGGGTAPVRWVGHRRLDCARHPRPWRVRPVRVAAHAFGPGVPARALFLSPDHALFAGGALIPVRYLLNGATVAQMDIDSVSYFHVELPRHGVLFAEGLPCESFLDTGNRAAFANGGGAMHLHADFARRVWDADAFAPLVRAGPAVAAARHALSARALALGHASAVAGGQRRRPRPFAE